MASHYALFAARYRPHAGGIESYTESLAHELAAQGNRVTVVTSKLDASPVQETQADGVEVVRLPCYALMNGRLPLSRRSHDYRELFAQLLDSGIDRVLVNARFYRHSLEGLRFARHAGASAVMLDHGSAYLVLGNPLGDVALKAYEHVITALGRRNSPVYAGVSERSAQWLATFGIHTTKVIPNAIDAPGFRALASTRDFRAELGVGKDQRLVAFVGRLTPEKGALALAQAAELLGTSFAFVMAGEGFLRSRIEELAVPNVHLLGTIGHADLSALLSQGDLFCLPTRSEGFCTSLLEAGAWGLVPVMPHVGGVDEVMGSPVRFGRVLSDVQPSTIARVLQDAVDAGACGHDVRLREVVERECSWQASVRALEACFDGVCS